MNKLEKRIIDISKKYNLSHLSSNLSAVNIIDEIFINKREKDMFILSSGHAGLSLYVILEKFYGINAEEMHEKHGVHPNIDIKNRIFCSSGSLGCGLPIACGIAMANKDINIYCLISDGEIFEGSIYESSNLIKKFDINNLKIYINLNGYSALSKLNIKTIKKMAKFLFPNCIVKNTSNIYSKFDFLKGLDGHYCLLK
jgi:transketolase N-terminal domain/subunit